METINEELVQKVTALESRLAQVESTTQQLTELLSSLATVTQHLMKANGTVVDAANRLSDQSK